MACSNIGKSHLGPTVYLPVNQPEIKDIFLAVGGENCVYPTPDTGIVYTADGDRTWFFSYQSVGNNVDANVAIDRVAVSFYGKLPFGKKLKAYFKTGGIKYYITEQEGPNFLATLLIYGNGQPTGGDAVGTDLWKVNPATLAPWVLDDITGGEFGFENTGLSAGFPFDLRGAYVEIYWGWGTTAGSGAGGVPAAAPCGQTVTLPNAFTNYEAAILGVTPPFGPLNGGTQVVIRGLNFIAGSTVTFGGLAATGVVFLDDEHYVATTPAHAIGFVDVVINEPNGASVVLRNGFQYTLFTRGEDFRRTPGINIRLGLNTGANSAAIRVDGDSEPPKVGEKIQVLDAEATPKRLLFAGNVQAVEQIYEGLNTQLAWNVTAVDFTWLLNRRRPFGAYVLQSVSDIVKDLINRYAPGFTTNFVQTKLARVSIFFDGSWDLQTCLSVLARMIGGGHWYVDFNQDVHFFHIVPPNFNLPISAPIGTAGTPLVTPLATPQPTGIVRLGPGSAMTAAEGGPRSGSSSPGFLFLFSTFVYSNGAESAYGPRTLYADDGNHKIAISNLAIGSPIGGLTVVKRRIYFVYNGPLGGNDRPIPMCQVNDNVTTAFQVARNGTQATSPAVTSNLGMPRPDSLPFVPKPDYLGGDAPQVSKTSLAAKSGQPEYRTDDANFLTWTPGTYRFRVGNIYQDGTESKLGSESNGIASGQGRLIQIDNVPPGQAIEGVPVIARRIYGALESLDFYSWWIIPNNTASSAQISPSTGQAQSGAGAAEPPPTVEVLPPMPPQQPPVWPNDDGPFLENFDLPDDVTDDSPLLLREPQITSTVDLSQIRNRIFIRGGGSSTTTFVAKGATSLPVADCSFFSSSAGQVFVEGSVVSYTGITAVSGPGSLIIDPLPEDVHQGAPVVLYLMLEDEKSQEDLGKIEVDANGNATDGVHEYTIIDGSLVTVAQLYMRGYAELELYSRPVTTVRYATRDPKSRPGALVKIKLNHPPINGEFLIQDIIIDQVHDESDLVNPRYHVVTSSSKFDLNDLFFQMNTAINTPPPPSAAGIVSAAVLAAPISSNPNNTNMQSVLSPVNFGSSVTPILSSQVWDAVITVAGSGVTDTEGYWYRLSPTGTGEGGQTGILRIPSANTYRCDSEWSHSWVIRTKEYPGVILWALLSDGVVPFYDGDINGNTRSINNGVIKGVGLRLDERGWAGFTADAALAQEYSPGFASGAAGTTYNLNVRVTKDLIIVTVNGVSISFAIPPTLLTVPLQGFMMLFNAETPSPNTGKTFDWQTISGFRG